MDKKSKDKAINRNRGITIISLIITIVLMLILVTVVISITSNEGIVNNAKKVKIKTEITELQSKLMKEKIKSEGEELNGTINAVLGIQSEYDNKLQIENGEFVYNKNNCTQEEVEVLKELKIKENE